MKLATASKVTANVVKILTPVIERNNPMEMYRADLEWISENDPSQFKVGVEYGLKKVKAFICEISVIHDVVVSESIKKWDSGEKITVQEKEQINKIENFFIDTYNTTIKLLNI